MSLLRERKEGGRKGRRTEGRGWEGRGLIHPSSATRRRVGRRKRQARASTLTAQACSGGPAEDTVSAGLPHLVLLLAPEAQARRPLLEALAVIGPRLVGLELHHRGGLLPLLL